MNDKSRLAPDIKTNDFSFTKNVYYKNLKFTASVDFLRYRHAATQIKCAANRIWIRKISANANNYTQ